MDFPFLSVEKKQLLFRQVVRMSLFVSLIWLLRLFWLHHAFDVGEYRVALVEYAERPSFLFILWNLFLAWIPYLAARFLTGWRGMQLPWPAQMAIACFWLLFFPNAPYIITDLVHLKFRAGVPFWADLVLLFSAAFTGLILGYLSLIEIHQWLRSRIPKAWTSALVILFLAGGGFGIYVGRFLRWNSWDVITRPQVLIADLWGVIRHPFANMEELGLAVLLFGFLYVGYRLFISFLQPDPANWSSKASEANVFQ
jgi:uncharacterized membrane protein